MVDVESNFIYNQTRKLASLSKAERENHMSADKLDTFAALTETVPVIQIRFFGSIRVVVNTTKDELGYSPDTTVSGLLRLLSDKYGEELRGELLDEKGSGGLRDDLMITLNDVIINHEKASETEIGPGDIVALYPTFPGGG